MRNPGPSPDRTLSGRILRAGTALLTLLYPPHCSLCAAPTRPGTHLCPACLRSAVRIRDPACSACSLPFSGRIEGPFLCPNCSRNRWSFQCAVSRYLSRGVVRALVHRFKYQRALHLRHPLALWLAEALDDPRLRFPPPDLLVPVPLHPAKLWKRQFNQAEVLAQLAARDLGVPVRTVLRRTRPTPTQTHLSRRHRMENLRGAFTVRQSLPVRNLHLILIDDVLTTGATLEACASALLQAGAASVRAATVARA